MPSIENRQHLLAVKMGFWSAEQTRARLERDHETISVCDRALAALSDEARKLEGEAHGAH